MALIRRLFVIVIGFLAASVVGGTEYVDELSGKTGGTSENLSSSRHKNISLYLNSELWY